MAETNEPKENDYPSLIESLEAVRTEMAALEPDDLLQIAVDPVAAVGTARGAMPRILVHREALTKLANFEIQNVDKLQVYASAALQANSLYLAASAPPERFQALVAEASKLRELLLSDITALANRDLINGEKLEELKGSVGFRNVASDVLTLMNMIRSNWDKVSSRTAVTMQELLRAESIGNQLVGDIGVREQAPAATAAFALERQQSYTLFVNAYDEVRRAITYLRWNEGDADNIAPSLFAGRSSGRKKNAAETATEPAASTPTASSVVASPTPATAGGTPAKVAVGLPGSDPFAQ